MHFFTFFLDGHVKKSLAKFTARNEFTTHWLIWTINVNFGSSVSSSQVCGPSHFRTKASYTLRSDNVRSVSSLKLCVRYLTFCTVFRIQIRDFLRFFFRVVARVFLLSNADYSIAMFSGKCRERGNSRSRAGETGIWFHFLRGWISASNITHNLMYAAVRCSLKCGFKIDSWTEAWSDELDWLNDGRLRRLIPFNYDAESLPSFDWTAGSAAVNR